MIRVEGSAACPIAVVELLRLVAPNPTRRRRSRALLNGSGGVASGVSQTCRDLFRDPGNFFSSTLIIARPSPVARRQFYEENASRLSGLLQTNTSSETSLFPRISAAETPSSCLAAWQRFEQRPGRLRRPIDGVPIAINPRNDETALHYGYKHQRKLVGVEVFRDFAVGLSFAESSGEELLEFAKIAFNGLPQRSLGDGRIPKQTCPSCNL